MSEGKNTQDSDRTQGPENEKSAEPVAPERAVSDVDNEADEKAPASSRKVKSKRAKTKKVEPSIPFDGQQPEVTTLPVDSIHVDEAVQCRQEMDKEQVDEYVRQMRDKRQFPPIDVVHVGDRYLLVDGFHRLAATRQLDREEVSVHVYEGTRRDALLFAAMANTTHGLRRSNADKERAVKRFLRDEKWQIASDREIAKAVAVDHSTVSKYRRELQASGEIPQCDARRAGDGRTMKVGAAGAKKDSVPKHQPAAEESGTADAPGSAKAAPASDPVTWATHEQADEATAVSRSEPSSTSGAPAAASADTQTELLTWIDDLVALVDGVAQQKVRLGAGADAKRWVALLDEQIDRLKAIATTYRGQLSSSRSAA